MQKILILDFGGQYGQLVARRVRECRVFCEICLASGMTMDKIRAFGAEGIILVGGSGETAQVSPEIFTLGVPVLGIGSGCLHMAELLGGCVCAAGPERGRTLTQLDENDLLFEELPPMTIAWMDQDGAIVSLPEGFTATAGAAGGSVAAFSCPGRGFYGLRFHPEVAHTEGGTGMIDRFLKKVCGISGGWTMEDIISLAVTDAKRRIGDRKVLLALSGGVDSSVAAAVLSRAVGSQLTCIFVDHGMLRKDEGDQVEAFFSRMDLHFVRVNAADRFLKRLEGITHPDDKRRIIGEEFVRVFEEEAKKLGTVDFLAQGTIYPDILEAGQGYADVIKSHREMGDLPDHIDFKELIEPLRLLFKDEVRQLGHTMGLPDFLVDRQPFPGPGLSIRIIGSVTPEKIAILQEADYIFRTELEQAHMRDHIGQYFAVLTDTRTVSVTGGERGCEYTLALRAVTTDDFLTAKWARIPYELLDKISDRIIRQVRGINRIVYDITNKPPATIEWE